MSKWSSIIVILQVIFFVLNVQAFANAESPYCNRTVTKMVYDTVLRTRQVEKKPTGVLSRLKTLFNKEIIIEHYTEQVPHVESRVVLECCKGYYRTRVGICEPQCTKGCPHNAYCVKPNNCQCKRGYIDKNLLKNGNPYCEPTCPPSCPEGCTFPNVCRGKKENIMTDSTDPTSTIDDTTSNEDIMLKSTESTSVADETTTNEDIMIKLTESTSTIYDSLSTDKSDDEQPEETTIDGSTSATVPKCAEGLTYFNGKCYPTQFSNDEFDCNFKPCAENAHCHDNGTCSCLEGYIWHKPTAQSDEVDTQTLAPICITLKQFKEITEEVRGSDEESSESHKWWITMLIGLGVLCIMGVVVFVVIQRKFCHRGKLDVEAKNDLYCEYDNRYFCENSMVL